MWPLSAFSCSCGIPYMSFKSRSLMNMGYYACFVLQTMGRTKICKTLLVAIANGMALPISKWNKPCKTDTPRRALAFLRLSFLTSQPQLCVLLDRLPVWFDQMLHWLFYAWQGTCLNIESMLNITIVERYVSIQGYIYILCINLFFFIFTFLQQPAGKDSLKSAFLSRT